MCTGAADGQHTLRKINAADIHRTTRELEIAAFSTLEVLHGEGLGGLSVEFECSVGIERT